MAGMALCVGRLSLFASKDEHFVRSMRSHASRASRPCLAQGTHAPTIADPGRLRSSGRSNWHPKTRTFGSRLARAGLPGAGSPLELAGCADPAREPCAHAGAARRGCRRAAHAGRDRRTGFHRCMEERSCARQGLAHQAALARKLATGSRIDSQSNDGWLRIRERSTCRTVVFDASASCHRRTGGQVTCPNPTIGPVCARATTRSAAAHRLHQGCIGGSGTARRRGMIDRATIAVRESSWGR